MHPDSQEVFYYSENSEIQTHYRKEISVDQLKMASYFAKVK